MTVHKVKTGNESGIRYSLPKPVLMVTPSPEGDGSFEVKVVYFPDESQTYAISSKTKMGKYKVNVIVDEGLLKKIILADEDPAIASELVRVAGEVAKAELERKNKEDEEKKKRIKEEKDAAEKELKTLQDSVKSKELELKLAEVELTSLESSISDPPTTAQKEALREATVKVEKAKITLESANEALAQAEEKYSVLEEAFNVPKGVASSNMAWGPVLFAINDTYDHFSKKGDVELKAVKWDSNLLQREFETVTAKLPRQQPKPPYLSGSGTESFQFPDEDVMTLKRTFIGKVTKIIETESFLENQKPDSSGLIKPLPVTMKLENGKDLIIYFVHKLEAGDYSLNIVVEYSPSTGNFEKTVVKVDFKVLNE